MFFNIGNESGKPCNRSIFGRCACVTACASSGKLNVCMSFFKHADHCKIAVDAADRISYYRSALVAYEIQLNAPAFKLSDDLRCAVAAPFLGTGGGKIYIGRRSVAFGKKLLDSLKERHDGSLGVSRSSAPDLTVGNVARKRLMRPFALGRDNVLMAHKKYRLLRAFTLPAVKQISVNLCFFKVFVNERKELFEQLMKSEKLFNFALICVRGRVILYHLGQFSGKAERLLLVLVRPVIRLFPGHCKRAYQCNKQKQYDHGRYNQKIFHHSAPLFFL